MEPPLELGLDKGGDSVLGSLIVLPSVPTPEGTRDTPRTTHPGATGESSSP